MDPSSLSMLQPEAGMLVGRMMKEVKEYLYLRVSRAKIGIIYPKVSECCCSLILIIRKLSGMKPFSDHL